MSMQNAGFVSFVMFVKYC